MAARREIDPRLLVEHAEFVRAAARAAIGRDDAVEDAVQDTLTTALTASPREPVALRSWLGAIARHRALDLVRRRKRIHARERRAARPESVPSTLRVAERAESGRILVDAVMALPETYRDAILLRYYDGLPPRRIGAALGISPEAARTRVKRGLQRLRETLDDRHAGDRHRWCVLLAPLVPRPRVGAPVGALLLGGLLMKKTVWIALALLAAVVLWQLGAQLQAPTDTPRADDPVRGAVGTLAQDDAPDAGSVPAGALSIDGVVRRDGAPLAARVEVRRVGDTPARGALHWFLDPRASLDMAPRATAPQRTMKSAADGSFRFEGLAEGRYEVRGVAEDAAWGYATIELTRGAPGGPVEIAIHGGPHALRGRIGFADGRPFRGFVLLATDRKVLEAGAATACVETSTEGRFEIEGLTGGEYSLAALAPGRSLSVRPVHVPAAGERSIVLDANLRAIRGRVVARDGGAPVAGASVVTSYGSEDFFPVTHATESLADGSFEILAGQGQAQVRVRAAAFAGRLLTLARGGDTELTIELARLATVTGVVRRADDLRPVAGVPVYAVVITERNWIANEFARGMSGDDGRFELPKAPAGTIAVFAFGEGWASPGLGSWMVEGASPFMLRVAPGARAETVLDVVPTAGIRGVLLDPAGAPRKGAVVTALLLSAGRLNTSTPMLSGLWQVSPLGSGRAVRTNGEGRFAFIDLPPDATWNIAAEHSAHAITEAGPVEVRAGEVREVELHLSEPHWVDLRVVDEITGAPVGGAVAQLVERLGGRSTRTTPRSWTTSEDGRARLGPLSPGRYALSLAAAVFVRTGPVSATEFEVGGSGPVTISATMRRGLRIAGRVVGPDGFSVAGTRACAIVEGHLARLGGTHRWTYPAHEDWCDVDGAFAFDGVAPGRYELRAERRALGRQFVGEATAEAGEAEVILQLVDVTDVVPQVGLVIVARDPGGTVVPQATVMMPGVSIAFQESPFVMPGPPSRATWIYLYGALDMAGQRLPVGPAKVVLDETTASVIDVSLPPERFIRGRVVRADGSGVGGAEIVAVPTDRRLAQPVRSYESRTISEADGAFELRYLGDFEYELLASAPGGGDRHQPLRVHAGADDVRVVLQTAIEGRLQLSDWRGEPVARARVRYRVDPGDAAEEQRARARRSARSWASYVEDWWDGRRRAPLTSDGGGAVSLPGLDSTERYELYVEGPEGRHDLLSIVKLGWAPTEPAELSFARGWRIHGVVVDGDGEPVADAQVETVGDGPSLAAWSDVGGRFEFDGLTGPELEVRVGLGTRVPADAPVRQLRAGAEPVVVRIDAGAELRVRVADWGPAYLQAMAYLSRADSTRTEEHRLRVEDDGRVRFRGLERDATYVLWIPLRASAARYVYRSGLRPGGDEVVVETEAGHVIRGRIRFLGEGPVDRISIDAIRGDVRVTAVAEPDGTFALRGLPEGSFTVRATARRYVQREGESQPRFGTIAEAAVEARADTDITIDLRPTGGR